MLAQAAGDHPLLVALAIMFGLGALAPLLARALGRNAGYPLAAGYAGVLGLVAVRAPGVIEGRPLVESLPWAPDMGVRLTLVLDGLSLFFVILVLAVGAVVMAYSCRYLRPEIRSGFFYSLLTLFAASMLGLVLAGDAIALFLFWELTSITSYFLIGGKAGIGGKEALRAFLVTGLGGLALFAGLILLAIAGGGTFDIPSLLADAPSLKAHPLAPAFLTLILIGAFTKSAQFPFHFWLRGAMVAPTPVSTYLHAAAMVKAGIYLLARFTPFFAGEAPWLYVIVFTGLVTAVMGAGMALKQHDLKALLAYSTVSQLGFIIALVGVGTSAALAAAAAHTLAHAAYKATLFMVVGIIDSEAGSRDIRKLSGLRKVMPITAVITALAALSMAGFPPFSGFVSKEEAFGAFLGAPGGEWLAPLAAAMAVTAAIMTFAYGARIFDGAFGGPLVQRLYEPPLLFKVPAGVTALAGLGLGMFISQLNPLIARLVDDARLVAGEVDLALWHGFTPALYLSALTLVGGTGLFLVRRRVDRGLEALRIPFDGTIGFDALYNGTAALGRRIGSPFLSSSPSRHLAWIFSAAVLAGGSAWLVFGVRPEVAAPPVGSEDWAVALLLAVAVTAVALARTRIAALAVLGIAGFLVAVFYVLLGGADLAITQLLVETLTVVLVVLVFRRMPREFRPVARARQAAAGAVALTAGALAALGTYMLTGRREISRAGRYFLESAVVETGGRNVVNTILVDFRALDTLGEITVLAVAALGVFALVRMIGGRGR